MKVAPMCFLYNLTLNELFIAECCETIKVIGGAEYGSREKHPSMFTNYKIEQDLINDNVHYTSESGKVALTIDTNGNWIFQDASKR